MLLYHSARGKISEAGFEPLMAPAHVPVPEGSVVFTDTPLSGVGPLVYVLNIPDQIALRFQIVVSLDPEGMRRFALPPSQFSAKDLHEYRFNQITGHEWDEFRVVLCDPQENPAAQPWSLVWVSRPGVAVVKDREQGKVEAVTIKLTPFFDPTEDYIIVEKRQYDGKKWDLSTIAGRVPMWADFPNHYARWAQNPEVIRSAADYLIEQVPAARLEVETARRQNTKSSMVRAWKVASERIGKEIRRPLGDFKTGSWTSVSALPIRIAQRLGPWEPPIPKPEYVNPENSGRVLLASADRHQGEQQAGATPFRAAPFSEARGGISTPNKPPIVSRRKCHGGTLRAAYS